MDAPGRAERLFVPFATGRRSAEWRHGTQEMIREGRGERGANAVTLPRSTDGAKAAAARRLLQRSLQAHTHTHVCM
jgi:hypothetical protein